MMYEVQAWRSIANYYYYFILTFNFLYTLLLANKRAHSTSNLQCHFDVMSVDRKTVPYTALYVIYLKLYFIALCCRILMMVVH